jgi:hypothetical protein
MQVFPGRNLLGADAAKNYCTPMSDSVPACIEPEAHSSVAKVPQVDVQPLWSRNGGLRATHAYHTLAPAIQDKPNRDLPPKGRNENRQLAYLAQLSLQRQKQVWPALCVSAVAAGYSRTKLVRDRVTHAATSS